MPAICGKGPGAGATGASARAAACSAADATGMDRRPSWPSSQMCRPPDAPAGSSSDTAAAMGHPENRLANQRAPALPTVDPPVDTSTTGRLRATTPSERASCTSTADPLSPPLTPGGVSRGAEMTRAGAAAAPVRASSTT